MKALVCASVLSVACLLPAKAASDVCHIAIGVDGGSAMVSKDGKVNIDGLTPLDHAHADWIGTWHGADRQYTFDQSGWVRLERRHVKHYRCGGELKQKDFQSKAMNYSLVTLQAPLTFTEGGFKMVASTIRVQQAPVLKEGRMTMVIEGQTFVRQPQ
ncbi:hypothetical protein KSF73_14190 [Burkholderiaceae bacterium DAT-1]|nr:hypothetical protein [Burkholderiaceae bacterium DAT-1]